MFSSLGDIEQMEIEFRVMHVVCKEKFIQIRWSIDIYVDIEK